MLVPLHENQHDRRPYRAPYKARCMGLRLDGERRGREGVSAYAALPALFIVLEYSLNPLFQGLDTLV